jgi:hypothetical protein
MVETNGTREWIEETSFERAEGSAGFIGSNDWVGFFEGHVEASNKPECMIKLTHWNG